MPTVSQDSLRAYRARTYRHNKPLKNDKEAVAFVTERGFVHFWPIKGIELPSLWAAVAGNRPVADDHDDPGHVTWRWKDSLLGKKVWYYAKILRRKATLIAPAALPYFYALSNNFGAPEEDYLLQYEQGKLTQEAKTVYETLLREGALDTPELRRAARMTSHESNTRFARALEDLQIDFKILPVAVAEVGAWRYAFVYDVTTRHLPDLPEQARPIGTHAARRKLAELYLQSVGAAQTKDLAKLFGWRAPEAEQALSALAEAGAACAAVAVEQVTGECWAAPRLCGRARRA
jgi:hypothetical protein